MQKVVGALTKQGLNAPRMRCARTDSIDPREGVCNQREFAISPAHRSGGKIRTSDRAKGQQRTSAQLFLIPRRPRACLDPCPSRFPELPGVFAHYARLSRSPSSVQTSPTEICAQALRWSQTHITWSRSRLWSSCNNGSGKVVFRGMGWRAALKSLKVRYLRFACQEEEFAFKKYCEKQILVSFTAALSFALVSLSLVWPSNYRNERARQDVPFMWELGDARTLCFLSVVLSVLLSIGLIALGWVQRCTRYVFPWSWELVVAFTAVFLQVALFFMSTCHTVLIHDRRPEEVFANSSVHVESYTLLAELTLVTAVCM